VGPVTVLWLWDAPPRCGVSGSLQRAQAAAGTALLAGRSTLAVVEAARLATSTGTLESAYLRTGQAWQASRTDGGLCWEPAGDRVIP
jgi:hypothetical protein